MDCWVYEVLIDVRVFVVTYGCFVKSLESLDHSGEHEAVRVFEDEELDSIDIHQGYKNSIRAWSRHPAFRG